MANNTIQIKRSAVTAQPSSLNPGELAYSNSVGGTGVLYIGSTDGATVVPIAGVRNPGTLTANQAIVTNATSYINRINTANLLVNFIEANGAGNTGTAGWILYSGGAGSNVYWASAGAAGTNTQAALTWSNTEIFAGNSTATSFLTVGTNLTINSISLNWIGNTTTSPTVVIANTGVIQTGNSSITGAPQVIVANSLGTTTVNTNIITTPVINAANVVTQYISANASYGTAGYVLYSGGTTANAYWAAASGGGSVNVAAQYAWTNTQSFSANVNFTATVNVATLNVTGNLVVGGTVTAINTQQLVVNDNIIELADGNLTTDTVDTGFFSVSGNSTAQWYSGLVRQAAFSNATSPYFILFGANNTNNPNTSSTITSNYVGTLQAYLTTGNSTVGSIFSNSSVTNITANSTVSVALVANSLTLTNALLATYGGTGILGSTYAAGDLLYAATAAPSALSRLSVASNGQVLQITNNLPAYGVLDGGTF